MSHAFIGQNMEVSRSSEGLNIKLLSMLHRVNNSLAKAGKKEVR
jgi:hypothetical protein